MLGVGQGLSSALDILQLGLVVVILWGWSGVINTILNKGGVARSCDKIINYSLEYGEIITQS